MPQNECGGQEFIKIFALNFFIATEFQNLLSTTKESSFDEKLLTLIKKLLTDKNSPLGAGAGAGAVDPAVLLVRVLRHPLAAVVEGGLDAAHAGQGVHRGLGRAEARVVTQPARGQGGGRAARHTPTPPAHNTDDRLGPG